MGHGAEGASPGVSLHKRKMRSGFGKQVDSSRCTAPSATLQGSERHARVYAGKSFESTLFGQTSPGAIYAVSHSTGKQVLSESYTAPAFNWGAAGGERASNVRAPVPDAAAQVPV